MNHEEQVGKNFAWTSLSQFVTRLFGLGFFIYMSHVLLEKGMGQYSFITTFTTFWFILSDFGISSYLYREWSKGNVLIEKIQEDFNVVLTLKLLMAACVFLPFVVINWFINSEILWPLILYYAFIVLSMFISHADIYLHSINNFKFSAIRELLEKTIVIIVGGIALLFLKNVISIFIAMIVAQIVSLLYYFKGRFPFRPRYAVNLVRMKFLIRKGLPFVLFAVFISIYGRIDMVMLRYMKNFETVGWYGAGYKAYEIANIFPGVLFLPAIFPVLSRIYNEKNRETYKNFFNRAIRILFSTSILLSIFFVFLAPYLISFLFPTSFAPSVLAMRIIILVLTISSLSVLFANTIIIQNKEMLSLKIVVISTIINVVLNLILIPRYSLYGAATATVIAEACNLYMLQHYVDWDKERTTLLKIGGTTMIVVLSLFYIRHVGYINNLYVGFGYILVLSVILWMLKLIEKDDLNMFYIPIKNKIAFILFNKNSI
ncbi:MAG: hypothetical protein COU32_00970 [Candidatus Magasanikbacteria bacterium CG10_big_fil_rev_8_21_14_0_10_42_10]|uniref:Uncharacterized protein n=1 Tax=Candidatus Magasanikbacteria bacterium CG10_big_fil_rev_8_21_14_0_10_42_10 TaxID=1974649 RepID=A0A2H0TWU0_9BACT|nr:MAG: hypothetical protein COU32_00970 [Candidatus Magasanikbacteria bacterium CG10_big_fil_rev_8_21_14_0_10_42_10]